jgi:hypothetical protein
MFTGIKTDATHGKFLSKGQLFQPAKTIPAKGLDFCYHSVHA